MPTPVSRAICFMDTGTCPDVNAWGAASSRRVRLSAASARMGLGVSWLDMIGGAFGHVCCEAEAPAPAGTVERAMGCRRACGSLRGRACAGIRRGARPAVGEDPWGGARLVWADA